MHEYDRIRHTTEALIIAVLDTYVSVQGINRRFTYIIVLLILTFSVLVVNSRSLLFMVPNPT